MFRRRSVTYATPGLPRRQHIYFAIKSNYRLGRFAAFPNFASNPFRDGTRFENALFYSSLEAGRDEGQRSLCNREKDCTHFTVGIPPGPSVIWQQTRCKLFEKSLELKLRQTGGRMPVNLPLFSIFGRNSARRVPH